MCKKIYSIMEKRKWPKKVEGVNFSTKILTIGCKYNPPRGGIAQVLFNYKKYIYNPFLFVANSKGEKCISSYLLLLFHPFAMLINFILHPNIQIVHIHTPSYKPFFYSTITAKIARLFKKKVLIHIHGGGFKEYYAKHKTFVRKELNNMDGVIVLSETWKHFFSDSIGLNNVHVINNVIPIPSISNNYIKEKQKVNLLFLGFIYKEKGIFDLIDVIKSNHDYFKDRLILHIGGIELKGNQLETIITTNKLNDTITLHGWVNEKEKNNLFNISDIYILPSYKEGLPMSIIEAMSYGLPIISTKVGGIPDLIADKKNGYLFTPGDKKEMFKHIKSLIENEQLRKSMGEYSFYLSKKYLPTTVKTQINNLYNLILSKK